MARWQWNAFDVRVFPYHALVDVDGIPHPACEPGDVVVSEFDLSTVGFVADDEAATVLAHRDPEPAAEPEPTVTDPVITDEPGPEGHPSIEESA